MPLVPMPRRALGDVANGPPGRGGSSRGGGPPRRLALDGVDASFLHEEEARLRARFVGELLTLEVALRS